MQFSFVFLNMSFLSFLHITILMFYLFVPWLQVPPSINCRLLAHQRDGVKFLYDLYRNSHGGVLGDDM
jgi:SNF2 family DNA or RNA helicase